MKLRQRVEADLVTEVETTPRSDWQAEVRAGAWGARDEGPGGEGSVALPTEEPTGADLELNNSSGRTTRVVS